MDDIRRLQADLKRATTMEEFLSICAQHYDFKNARIGPITRSALITGIPKIIHMSGAKPKK